MSKLKAIIDSMYNSGSTSVEVEGDSNSDGGAAGCATGGKTTTTMSVHTVSIDDEGISIRLVADVKDNDITSFVALDHYYHNHTTPNVK